MISLLQNKAKAILEYLYMILSKFFSGTINGIKFFSIQIFMWIAIELFLNFKIVTVDKYMLGGWLIPLYGLSILILKKLIKKWLCNYPKIMNMIRMVLNVFTLLLVCLILFIFLKGRL